MSREKNKETDVLVYADTDKEDVYWVCFNQIGLDAFKAWIKSVALAKHTKVKFTTQKREVNFRRKTRK